MAYQPDFGALLAAALTLAACVPMPASAGEGDRVPVMIGGEPAIDACGALGAVANLQPVPGNSLSVRVGPGLEFERVDQLAPGARLWLCDRSGPWLGVVYAAGAEDCGVASPVTPREPYRGACRSGWVHERYVELLAG